MRPRIFTSTDFAHLETIRGIAALYVVLNHARGLLWCGHAYLREHAIALPGWQRPGGYLNLLTILGHEFVILFFILSGFSIAYSLSVSPAWRGFLARRFMRLYPPYLVSLFYAAGVMWLCVLVVPDWIDGPDPRPYFDALATPAARFLDWESNLRLLVYSAKHVALPQNWSLIHEWYFYLLIPFVIAIPRTFLVAGLVLLLASRPFGADVAQYSISEFVFHYAAFFALGVWLFLRYDRIASAVRKLGRRGLIVLAIVLFVAMLASRVGREPALPSELIAAALSAVLVVLFLEFDLRLPILPRIGELSYTLYVTHYASIVLAALLLGRLSGHVLPITNPYVWWCAPPIAVGMSWVLYHLAEKPSKRWISARRRATQRRE